MICKRKEIVFFKKQGLKTYLDQYMIMNVTEMEVKEVEMVDDQLNKMMVMDIVYLVVFYDDKEVKQLHIMMRMKTRFLRSHDDVLRKMVQRISVYNLLKQSYKTNHRIQDD